ncbi:MAG: hydroxymyristoyl-ACP dehydratase [Gammaproteobacteria bacterium]|nr:hydroxymyristoyl-ACP dehydratase [Gammaproteobacteria bacterium]
MNGSIDLQVAASHPCFPGHFPGNSIVPAVVILDLVSETILARHPDCKVSGFPQVKFLSPVAPETGFRLTWTERPDGDMDFYCDVENQRLVQGRIRIEEIQ